MKLSDFLNIDLLHPINVIIILLIVALMGVGLSLIVSPHQAPEGT